MAVRVHNSFHPYRSFTRFPIHGSEIATVVPLPVAAAPPRPGQTQSRLFSSSTGRKNQRPTLSRCCRSRDRLSTAGEERLRTAARTQAARYTQQPSMFPRESAHEFPAESEDSVFHPQRTSTDPCQKPSREAGHGHRIHPGDPPSTGVPTDAGHDARSHPRHPQRDSLKREELPPGLERALISEWHLASP